MPTVGRLAALLLACAALLTVKVQAWAGDGTPGGRLDAVVARGLHERACSGAVLLVVRRGTVLYEQAYGLRRKYDARHMSLATPEVMTVDTRFDVASLTKVCATTFGIMLLVDRGAVELDAPLGRYLPLFGRPDKQAITLRHLLAHRSGLPAWKPVYCHAADRAGSEAYIAALPLESPPGAEYRYSDLGFMLLGDVIEAVSGRPLDRFLGEELYAPLGLRGTGFAPRGGSLEGAAATSAGNPLEERMAAAEERTPQAAPLAGGWRTRVLSGEVNDGNAFYARQGVAGHAGLFSTARDLARLADLLLGRGTLDGRQFITARTVDAFLAADDLGNALGWQRRPAAIKADGAPAGSFGHTGFTGCNLLVVPERDLVVVFLTNRQHEGLNAAGSYTSLDPLRREIAAIALEDFPARRSP